MHTHTNTHMNMTNGRNKDMNTHARAYTYENKYAYEYVLGTLSRSFCSTVRLGACVGDCCQGCAFACRSCWGMCTWYAIAFVLLDRQAGCVCWGRLSGVCVCLSKLLGHEYLVRYRVRFARPSGWVRVMGTTVSFSQLWQTTKCERYRESSTESRPSPFNS